MQFTACGFAVVAETSLNRKRKTAASHSRIRFREMKFYTGGVGGGEQHFSGLQIAQDRIWLFEIIQIRCHIFAQSADRFQSIGGGEPLLGRQAHFCWIESILFQLRDERCLVFREQRCDSRNFRGAGGGVETIRFAHSAFPEPAFA